MTLSDHSLAKKDDSIAFQSPSSQARTSCSEPLMRSCATYVSWSRNLLSLTLLGMKIRLSPDSGSVMTLLPSGAGET